MKSSRIFLVFSATAVSAQIVNTYPDCVKGPLASNGVCNVTLSPSQRAAALVAAMTNDEKLQNIVRYSHVGFPSVYYLGVRSLTV